MTRPAGPARIALGGAVLVWMGAALGWSGGGGGLAAAVLIGAAGAGVRRARPAAVAGATLLVAGAMSGALAAARTEAVLAAPVPAGPVTLAGRVVEDPAPGPFGSVRFVFDPEWLGESDGFRWDGPRLEVVGSPPANLQAGDRAVVSGTLRAAPRLIRGDPVAGRLAARAIVRVPGGTVPLFRLANAVRARIGSALDRGSSEAALLSGFLVGDTRRMAPADLDALRRAGLTHFVAVSGSNVALFLGAWWLAAGPLAAGMRTRAAWGLAGLVLFVVVTRWEPSVLRAAAMAGVVLAGRFFSIPVDVWAALGTAVAGLLLVSGQLVADVGFQLSVAATVGVLVAVPWAARRRPRWLWGPLAATLGAQAAVTPLLLWHFGTVPLLSPLANLVAAPLVAAATTLGGLGALSGVEIVTRTGLTAAGAVLAVARTAAGWPQLGPAAAAGAAVAGLALASRRLRPVVAVGLAVVVVAAGVGPGPPAVPTAVFLDVGQGDATLLRDPSGASVLVDGGPDPVRLLAGLRRHGVRRLDLVVASHGDLDHVGGLAGLTGVVAVGAIWHPDQPSLGEVLPEVLEEAAARNIPATAVRAGMAGRVGDFHLAVLGPRRRYAAENDGSVVVLVTVGATTLLLSGDTGAVAQRELGPVPADVMLVPHHGAATTDLAWLAASAAPLAVISVGESNRYGHPAPQVVAVLAEAGSEIRRTDRLGDVEVALVAGATLPP